MYQAIDFFQFQKRFATEARCRKFLIKQRWGNGYICPKCGYLEAYYIKTRITFQCKQCRHQVSLTSGTIFHKTKIPLRKWFWMIFLMAQSKHSYSVMGLQRLLKIKNYKAAWLMAHKIRHALSDRDARYLLTGIIEMDDSYFGSSKTPGKRGRGADKKSTVVVSAQTNEFKKPVFASMTVVPKINSENVSSVSESTVSDGSTVKTDGWKAYHALKERNIIHEKHIIGDPKKASEILPAVHLVIANCKGILRGIHHGVSKKHLHLYLAEFCYRFNRRFWQDQVFDRMIKACLSTNTITLAELRC